MNFQVGVAGIAGFNAPVTLEVCGPDTDPDGPCLPLPAGISAVVTQNPVTPPGAGQLSLSADESVTASTLDVVIRGTGGGIRHEIRSDSTLDFGLTPICYGAIDGHITDEEPPHDAIEGAAINPPSSLTTNDEGYYKIDNIELNESNDDIDAFVLASKYGYWDAFDKDTVAPAAGTAMNRASRRRRRSTYSSSTGSPPP